MRHRHQPINGAETRRNGDFLLLAVRSATRQWSIWGKNHSFRGSDLAHEQIAADAGERGSCPGKRHRMGVLPSSSNRTKGLHGSLSAKGRK